MTDGQDYGQPDQYPQRGPGQPWGQEQWPPQYGQPGPGQQGDQGGSWQREQYEQGSHRQRLGQPQQSPYPQQGQPWAQPGYQAPQGAPGWQQPGYGQPPPWGQQYSPGPQRPPGRKRHTARNVLASIGGLIVVIIIAVVVASGGGHTVQTTGSTASGTGSADSGKAAGSAPKTAGIGSAITLSGNGNGEQMSVTVTKVISNASPGDELTSAPAGDRLYAVQFRLRDTGSGAYSDSPSNGTAVTDSAGQSYQAAITDTAAGCTEFPASENIAPGASGLGCIVFEVPTSAKITQVQFTLDSGMGPQTGQWNVG